MRGCCWFGGRNGPAVMLTVSPFSQPFGHFRSTLARTEGTLRVAGAGVRASGAAVRAPQVVAVCPRRWLTSPASPSHSVHCSNNFNDNSGEFEAPLSGVYYVTATLRANNANQAGSCDFRYQLLFQINGVTDLENGLAAFDETTSCKGNTLSIQALPHLNKGDKVRGGRAGAGARTTAARVLPPLLHSPVSSLTTSLVPSCPIQIRLLVQSNQDIIVNTRSYISFTLMSTDAVAEYIEYARQIKAIPPYDPYQTLYTFYDGSRA